MSPLAERRKIRAVVYLLDQAGHFNQLAKSCPPRFAADFYRLKDRHLAEALAKAPEQFEVDSVGIDGLIGLTHRPSGRRAHLVVGRLPVETVKALQRLPVAGCLRRVRICLGERSGRAG